MKRYQGQATRDEGGPQLPDSEQGYMLLGLIVAIAIILIALSVAASEVAFSLRREREVEAVRRGNQFVRAIQLYYKKFGHYPGSIEQLEKINNMRFLRQRYVDPLTGKADWRLIAVGKNQTTVKGFFGEPLTGLATTGLGSAAGMTSTGLGGAAGPGGVGTTGTGVGAAGVGSTAGTSGVAGVGGGAAGAAGSTDSASSAGGFGSLGGIGSQSATSFGGSTTGPFMGVGSAATGSSLIELNEQTTYETWEFLYDPRVELLKAKAALNSGIGSAGAGSLGQTPGAFGSTTPGGTTGPNGSGTTGPGSTGTTTTPQP
jgi:type II secretory pathway pseudopilin PulG